MKKNYVYTLLIILFGILLCKLFENDTKNIEVDGVKYAVSVDGEKTNKFPSAGLYDVSIICEGAEANWNYEEWVAEIYNIEGDAFCDVSFEKKETTGYLNDYIINLVKTEGTVLYDNGSTLEEVNDNYIYRGPNPDNYIKFNGELWRIIGIYKENYKLYGSDYLNYSYLVKIIRNSSIASISWDDDVYGTSSGGGSIVPHLGSNNFIGSLMNIMLNSNYYQSKDEECMVDRDSTWSEENQYTSQCNFSGIGIKNEYKKMIVKTRWDMCGYDNIYVESNDSYDECRTNNTEEYIGLMYVSDYGYAASSNCASKKDLSDYNDAICVDNNWLKSDGEEWTMTYSTDFDSYVFYITSTGEIDYTYAASGKNVRPVVYLSPYIYITSGTGTQSDPYIIGL